MNVLMNVAALPTGRAPRDYQTMNGSAWRSTFTTRSSVRLKKQIKKYSYMSIAQTNTIAKVAAVVAGLGLVAMTFVAAAPAKAATAFNTNLTIGSRGTDVTALQTWLISEGYQIPAGATGYFGGQTKAALAAYQTNKSISPAVGYFGPLTRAAVNSQGGSTGSTGGSTGGLKGAGRLTDVNAAGDIESDIDEGDSGVKVAGVEAMAKDGDVSIQRLDVNVHIGGNGSKVADKYFSSMSVWLGSKKLATMDASDGDKSSATTTFRFSNLNGVIKEGDQESLYIAIDAIDSIDSTEDGDNVDIQIPVDGVRGVSADGVSETYVTTAINQTFTVSSVDTGELQITESSDNPDDTSVKVDDNTTTDDVTLLDFNLKAKKQDVTVNDIAVQVATTHNVGDTVQTLKLMKGSKVLKTKSVSTAATISNVVFNDLNAEDISKDDTETYSVVATIKRVGTGGFVSGDTIVASTTSGLAYDTEDADGNSATLTGSAIGGTVTLQTTGITVTKGSITATKTVGTTAGSGDTTQFAIPFKVTADEDDLYISRTVTKSTSTSGTEIRWATTTSGTATSTASTAATLSSNDTNNGDVAGYYKVPAGTTRTFTLNVSAVSNQTGFVGVKLVGIGYGTTTAMGQVYSSNLDTFKTEDVSMTTH